jgi:hypothetical protein
MQGRHAAWVFSPARIRSTPPLLRSVLLQHRRSPRHALHHHHLATACSIFHRAPLTHSCAQALLCVAKGSKARPYFAFRHLDIAGAPPSSPPHRGQPEFGSLSVSLRSFCSSSTPPMLEP